MNDCNHSVRQKDNYGETCLLCGETLAGYGCQGEAQNHCHHIWNRMEDQEVCQYCEQTRLYNPEEKETARSLILAARRVAPQIITFIETWLVAKVSPRDIESLIRTTGGKNPEHWYLIAKYFYDFQ